MTKLPFLQWDRHDLQIEVPPDAIGGVVSFHEACIL